MRLNTPPLPAPSPICCTFLPSLLSSQSFLPIFLCSLSLLQQAPTLPHSCSTLFLSSSVWWCASPPFNEQLGRSILFILQSSLCSRVLINHLLYACASVNHHILIPPPNSRRPHCVCVCLSVLFTYPTVPFFLTTVLADGNKMKANSLEYYGFSKTMHFRDELQCLESLLHFPEEVAHRLTQVEHELFYSIEPVHYIRQGKWWWTHFSSFRPPLSPSTISHLLENITENETKRKLVHKGPHILVITGGN